MSQEEIIFDDPNTLLEKLDSIHPSDIAESLKLIEKNSEDDFFFVLKQLPDDILGEVLLELPDNLRDDAYEHLSVEQLSDAITELDSDDQTDIIQEIEDLNENKAHDIFVELDEDDKKEIDWLKTYDENEAGSYMQMELFSVKLKETIGESIERLKIAKREEEIENVHQVYIVNQHKSLLGTIMLEDLIMFDFSTTYEEILNTNNQKYIPQTVADKEHIDEVAKKFEKYDLNAIAVVGYNNILLGRITSDDIIDVIEQNATDQIYQLAGVDDETEYDDNFFNIAKNRGMWLFLNLGTAILASMVIALFDTTIQSFVALAVLMPIVASMGGNAGTQTLAVMVRKLALGDIGLTDSKDAIFKEIFVSLLNGIIFAIIMGLIAWLWYDNPILGVVIGLAIIFNLFCAGFFGACIPLILKKLNFDPAIGSTVLLTTVTDIVGFFSFLMLAKLILL